MKTILARPQIFASANQANVSFADHANKEWRAMLAFLSLSAMLAMPVSSWAVSPNIVIAEIYGGAGCGTANCSTYKNDYIGLFNRGSCPVSVTGWSVQYASASGTSWAVTPLTGTIPPGGYLLVASAFHGRPR